MLLAIHIGNSGISVGVLTIGQDGEMPELRSRFSISGKSYSADEYTVLIHDFLTRSGIQSALSSAASSRAVPADDSNPNDMPVTPNDLPALDCAVISSVVPKMTDLLSRCAQRLCGCPPFLVTSGIHTGFGIRIRNPEQLGADLVCNAAAALHLTKVPFVVLDMSTASTLTVVDSHSDVLGTIIVPGLRTSMNAMLDSAAQLSDIPLERPDELIGRDTRSSICSGVLNGNILMIDGFIRNIREELGIRDSGEKLGLLATGEEAQSVLPYTRNKFTYIEDLTLLGAACLYAQNRKSR